MAACQDPLVSPLLWGVRYADDIRHDKPTYTPNGMFIAAMRRGVYALWAEGGVRETKFVLPTTRDKTNLCGRVLR